MTLFIAFVLLNHVDANWLSYLIASGLWVVHLLFHADFD